MKIAIASGKGGTGKTTLSTNLASYLSENHKVVLADLDVEEPNSGLFLKSTLIKKYDKFRMVPEWNPTNCTLCGNCQKVCNFHAVITLKTKVMVFPQLCHGCYACSELCPNNSLPMRQEKMGELKHFKVGKLDFVESKLDVGQEQAVPLISQTLEFVDDKYSKDTIKLYDSPPGTSCPVIEATKDADFVILITEPTPFGFHDLKLAIDTMRVLKKEIGVVVNRYGIGNNDVIDYCEKEKIPVIATLPNDRKIAELYSRGELLYDKIPAVKKELEKISTFILNRNIGGNK
ncbi:MAG: ATP-binding protein [Candidatus Delongbacteria bacterium]|jgi:MinD superfamily P-loop ATPase|nr:ATP-binding protein [Candidatus Delongbacteria bacterium]